MQTTPPPKLGEGSSDVARNERKEGGGEGLPSRSDGTPPPRGMQAGGLEVELNGLETFADYFMDGFLVDWMVQDRIREARDRVAHAGNQVIALLRRLRARSAQAAARVAELEGQRAAIVEAA
jgi:hypothetical protein